MINIPVTFETLLKVIDSLSPEQKRMLQQHLKAGESPAQVDQRKSALPGSNMGTIETKDDFDELKQNPS